MSLADQAKQSHPRYVIFTTSLPRSLPTQFASYPEIVSEIITKTRLFKYMESFPSKTKIFQIKNSDIFHISAQNIDCGYSLEPPRRGGSNEYPQSMFYAEIRKIMYTPVNPSFTI